MAILNQCDTTRALLASPPVISSEIKVLDNKTSVWMRDGVYQLRDWPENVSASEFTELEMIGDDLPVERGLGKWRQWTNSVGCDPCPPMDCSYNETTLGGFGLRRRKVTTISREFKTEPICVREVQTTQDFKEMIGFTVKNMQRQISRWKELSIGQNILTGFAKKFVVASEGPRPNTTNPFMYPNIGTAVLSELNIMMLEMFYEYMRNSNDAEPYDTIDNNPIFALTCSKQLLRRMYLNDSSLRQDLRFSGLANDLLTKYNFGSIIGGMFLPATIQYPRRFRFIAGEAIEILPTVNGVVMDTGTGSGQNPNYYPGTSATAATHEEVLIYPKYPFSIYTRSDVTSVGGGTVFGKSPKFFDEWEWVNIKTEEDWLQRQGFFGTAGTIAISSQHSQDIYGILVPLPSVRSTAVFLPYPACPPVAPEPCENDIPAQECPCPMVLSSFPNPVVAGEYFVTFAVPLVDVEPDDVVQLGLKNGGYVNATNVLMSADGKAGTFTFPVGTSFPCNQFTTVFCNPVSGYFGCTSQVESYAPVVGDATRLTLILRNPIKAVTAAQVVTLYYGNCTTQSATVITADSANSTWVVDIGATAFADTVGGVTDICVPLTTDATCPACGVAAVGTQCVPPA